MSFETLDAYRGPVEESRWILNCRGKQGVRKSSSKGWVLAPEACGSRGSLYLSAGIVCQDAERVVVCTPISPGHGEPFGKGDKELSII